MARVFVSHAGDDLALARDVHRWLSDAGHEVFLDKHLHDGIVGGEDWKRQLYQELHRADAVVCVVTSAFLASRWCADEVGAARSQGSRLLPIIAEPGVVDPLLMSVQHVDWTRDPDAVRPFLIRALQLVDTTWPQDRSPFPGLRPFKVDQHQVFFGRMEETEKLAKLLRSPAEHAEGAALLVVGPSGCGKSSLVRAGLVPVMAKQPDWWTLPPIVSGADPVAALVRELAAARQFSLNPTVTQVRQQLDNGGLRELADELLLAAPGGPRRRLLVVVDQFEELLTQTAPTERARFAELLRPTLDGPIQLVATLRPEFLDQLLADPDLATLPMQVHPLRPLRRDALRAVIEKPARLAGLGVDDGLVDRLIEDTASGEALPLLAFTLAELAEGITRGGRLSSTRYDELGGVQGALKRQANSALAAAVTTGGRSSEKVIAGLLRLVTVDEQGRPTRWRINRAELPAPMITEWDVFITRRLLTTDADNSTVVIGIAHEAFLSAWPPLAEAITASVSALQARRTVEHTASEWNDSGRLPSRLWGDRQLAAAVDDTGARITPADAAPKRGPRWFPQRNRVLVTDHVDLSLNAREFLYTSIRRDRRRRRNTTAVLTVLLSIALSAAIVAYEGQQVAQEQQQIATARQLITQADAIRDTDPRTALLLGIAAVRIRPSDETQASLVNTLTTTRYAGTLADATGAMSSVAFAPDGRTLATADSAGAVILWDLTTPAHSRRSLAGHTRAVNSVAFAPDGRTLATASSDGTVILWDLVDPARPQQPGSPLTSHADAVFSVVFAPDGRTLATGDSNGSVILWDLVDQAHSRRSLTGHTRTVNSVAFAPDGHRLATASDDSTVIVWELTDGTQPQPLGPPLTSHTSRVTAVAFAPDGRTLATAGDDSTVIVWELTDGTQPQPLGPPLTSHTSRVTAVAFAPDGRTLATTSFDGTVIRWDLTDRAQPLRLGPSPGQPGPVDSVMFAPDGRTLDITISDGTVIQRDATDPKRLPLGPPRLRSSAPVNFLALAPDGNIMVAAGDGGSVLRWDLTDRIQPQFLGRTPTGHRSQVSSAVFSTDGRILATGSDDGDVILWDFADRTQPQPLGPPLTGHRSKVSSAVFSTDGRTLATASNDGSVILRDLTDRTQPRPFGKLLTGHTGSVTSVAFAPDGNTLASGGLDATVILWDLTDLNERRADATERACDITGRGLTPAEWGDYIPGLPYQDTCHPITAGGQGSR